MSAADRTRRDAAAWVARLHAGDPAEADRKAFAAWLEQDPAHGASYAEHLTLWDELAGLGRDPGARALLMGEGRRRPRRAWAYGAGAGLVAAAAALALFLWPVAGGAGRYAARPGQLRTVALEDGSSVVLDAASLVRVRYTAGERRIVLERGRAYFRVAKDPRRPFRVFAGADEVRALGTAFEVAKVGEHARVVLQEGRLAVYPGRGPPRLLARVYPWAEPAASPRDPAPALVMSPGQEVRLAAAGPPVLKTAPAEAAAWRFGRLVFDDTPLDEAAEDLSAHGGPRVVLADPSLASIRVSGVFHMDRPHETAAALAAAFSLRLARDDAAQIVLERR